MKGSLAAAVSVALIVSVSGAFGVVSPDDKRRELQDLQERIGALEETLVQTRGQRDSLLRELEELERRVGRISRALRDLARDLLDRTQAMDRLQQERALREGKLESHRAALKRQLRAAFVMGRQERLKLLLSQEQPGLLSRMMAYHEYVSLARAGHIREIGARLEELRAVQAAVAEERSQLQRLHAERMAEQEQLDATRSQREELVAELDRVLQEKDASLASLKRDAAALEELIERLERDASAVGDQGREPIARRKGQLAWPVAGRLSVRFGSARASGGLEWDGVVINAAPGTEVKAIHRGRVAFADWLRGFGLLIILDHGEGYMSLYGFNQALLKETGEWVEESDTIALVGDSGGRNHSSLYFGIRHRGRPNNPRNWCRQ